MRRCSPTVWTSACYTPRDPENPQTSHRGQTGVGLLYLSPTEEVGGDEAVWSDVMDECLPYTQGPREPLD